MNFKINKVILFCNRRITPQIARNINNNEYLKWLLETTKNQASNNQLKDIDFSLLFDYILYTLGSYYRGNTIFVFQLLVAFLYLITPVDIVNDFLPGIGYLDDLLLFKLILDTYINELETFKKLEKESLDIEYVRADPKVVAEFTIEPSKAVELIIEGKKLELIEGENIINELLSASSEIDIADLINFDVVEILKYELLNYMLVSKKSEIQVDDELLLSLIQIPNLITTKDVNYFLKNIKDIMQECNIEISREKKALFNTNTLNLKYNIENITIKDEIIFTQNNLYYNDLEQMTIVYKSNQSKYLNYKHVVEIIDLVTKKHLFVDTTLYFNILVQDYTIKCKVEKEEKTVVFFADPEINNCIADQLNIIAKIIKEKI